MDIENYRGIHLLSSFLNVSTKIIEEKLKEIINILYVQQGFTGKFEVFKWLRASCEITGSAGYACHI